MSNFIKSLHQEADADTDVDEKVTGLALPILRIFELKYLQLSILCVLINDLLVLSSWSTWKHLSSPTILSLKRR